MQKVIGDLIHALRHAGLPISPAETLDALHATQLIGLQDPARLKTGLALTLAKSHHHQIILSGVFDRFFSMNETSHETDNEQPSDSSEQISSEESSNNNDSNSAEENTENPDLTSLAQSALAQQLMANDQSELQIAITAAGEQAGAGGMQIFSQKPVVSYRIMQALGEGSLNQTLRELAKEDKNLPLIESLKSKQSILRQQVKDYVEEQFVLFSKNAGAKLRDENLVKIKLSNIDHSYHQHMTLLVRKAAKQLASMHSRRRRVTKRGLLDVRKTIAANAAYDGFLFHTKWKSTRIERPKVMVLCDVSGSVSRVARFLLLFLYSLQDVLPRVRSFVFASDLGEVTEQFDKQDIAEAIGNIMDKWANLPTDYGQALSDFNELALKDIDNKTTVIMLGDARNNKMDGNTKIWNEVYRRSQRVLWLNPESRTSWDSGDSIMSEYSPYCSRVEHCSSLRDLTRILGSLLKHS